MRPMFRIYFLTITFLITFAFTWIVKAEPSKDASKKSQLESLIIWKMSEELKLSPTEEKKFQELFLKLSSEKSRLSDLLETQVQKMNQAKSDSERSKSAKEYRQTLVQFHQLPVKELDQMQKLLGIQRFAKYLDVKNDLSQKVKSLILEKSDKKPLPKPQVIE